MPFFGSDNDLALNRRQAIIWANIGQVNWCLQVKISTYHKNFPLYISLKLLLSIPLKSYCNSQYSVLNYHGLKSMLTTVIVAHLELSTSNVIWRQIINKILSWHVNMLLCWPVLLAIIDKQIWVSMCHKQGIVMTCQQLALLTRALGPLLWHHRTMSTLAVLVTSYGTKPFVEPLTYHPCYHGIQVIHMFGKLLILYEFNTTAN